MIEVIKAGMFSTIQDLGRFGYRKYGVPVSGAMDKISAGLANALLDNDSNDAVMEITMSGPKLRFTKDTLIAISGANMQPMLNGNSILNNKVTAIAAGDILEFGKLINGLRCYLAVLGGFKTPICLESRSFYKNITIANQIKAGDSLLFQPAYNISSKKGYLKSVLFLFETIDIEVFKGPEYDQFSSKEIKKILDANLTISNHNNRMGYRLNEHIITHNKSMLTSPVLPGTVQITPNGNLVILMQDAQTTGGYPRIFQLTKKSMSILAQKKTGDSLKFKLVR
jgi:biotin-dependent carboxylase-like uncharacterized protein